MSQLQSAVQFGSFLLKNDYAWSRLLNYKLPNLKHNYFGHHTCIKLAKIIVLGIPRLIVRMIVVARKPIVRIVWWTMKRIISESIISIPSGWIGFQIGIWIIITCISNCWWWVQWHQWYRCIDFRIRRCRFHNVCQVFVQANRRSASIKNYFFKM